MSFCFRNDCFSCFTRSDGSGTLTVGSEAVLPRSLIMTCPPEERWFQQRCTGALLPDPEITRAFVPTLCSTARFSCLYLSNQFREEFSSERTLILLNHDISHQTLTILVFVVTSERVHKRAWTQQKSTSSFGDPCLGSTCCTHTQRWGPGMDGEITSPPRESARFNSINSRSKRWVQTMSDGLSLLWRPQTWTHVKHFLSVGGLFDIGGDWRKSVNIWSDGPGEYNKFFYLLSLI